MPRQQVHSTQGLDNAKYLNGQACSILMQSLTCAHLVVPGAEQVWDGGSVACALQQASHDVPAIWGLSC